MARVPRTPYTSEDMATSPPDSGRGEDSRHRGPEHASPYPVSRLGAPISLVDAAREIAQADALIRAGAEGELLAIAEQIRALQQRAQVVVERAQRDAELHRAHCNFQRKPGKTYHLYARQDGQRLLSMLSPADWGGRPPHRFLGSYRLEVDQSWTPAEQAEELDSRRAELEQALATKSLPGGSK